jgi:hypothetical protein
MTKNIWDIIFISLLTFGLMISCKKREERDLIKNYIGTYSVTCIAISCCDSIGHPSYSPEQMELDVKKSWKGIKIKGVDQFDNFDVNYKDSTLHVNKKNSEESVYGKLYPNDSIYLRIYYSAKLPMGKEYRMKKK